jgi:energy-coupling factor transporter ATP-binding protein EcfA2
VPLVFDQVSFSYGESPHLALDNVSLRVEEGSFTALIGCTGSGKSTLAQLADALLVPDSGHVLVDGMDTADKKRRRRVRQTVGVVFQRPEQQLFAATVADELAFGMKCAGIERSEFESRSRAALSRVGLDYDALSETSPFALSGGERRRVALASILVLEPRYLVLDEPAAGMDPRAVELVYQSLVEINRQGTAIVLISHDMNVVAHLAGHVIALDNGRVLADGAPEEVFSPGNVEMLRAAGLDVPSAMTFALELGAQGLDLGTVPLTTEQLVEALSEQLARKDDR